MEKFQYLNKTIIEFEKLLQEFGGEVKPCTQEEVEELESMLPSPYHLPAAYKEFLLYGGKKMAGLFKLVNFSYGMAKHLIFYRDEEILEQLQSEDPNAQLPADIFVINEHLGANFTYFRLTEGNDPPIYIWEEGKGGLEVSKKEYESFSDFLRDQIRIHQKNLMLQVTREKLEAGQPIRDKQFWDPTDIEQIKGIKSLSLMRYFGFYAPWELEKAAAICGLKWEQYLEELSSWQARQVDGEMRFFPPKA
jgi:hypothetical protein